MIHRCPSCGIELLVTLNVENPLNRQHVANERSSAAAALVDTSDMKSLLEQIHDDDLAGAQAKFVMETRERFEKYGARTRMSEKQLAWLKRIAAGETGNDW